MKKEYLYTIFMMIFLFLQISFYGFSDFMFFLLNFSTFSQNIKIPKGYKELKKVEGDLNKDGIKELVIAYDTGVEGDFGTEREVYVYKKSGNYQGRVIIQYNFQYH